MATFDVSRGDHAYTFILSNVGLQVLYHGDLVLKHRPDAAPPVPIDPTPIAPPPSGETRTVSLGADGLTITATNIPKQSDFYGIVSEGPGPITGSAIQALVESGNALMGFHREVLGANISVPLPFETLAQANLWFHSTTVKDGQFTPDQPIQIR